jgi:methionine sulfoxide reductase catalytic subunit
VKAFIFKGKPVRKNPRYVGNIHPLEIYLKRREFLRRAGYMGSALGLSACGLSVEGFDPEQAPSNSPETPTQSCQTNTFTPPYEEFYPATANANYQVEDPAQSGIQWVTQYNNFYEFSFNKGAVCEQARNFPTYPWTLEVGGLVNNPQSLTLDDLMTRFTLEERVYRFRCVETWSMVVPWTGFPMRLLMDLVQPRSDASFVRFVSAYEPEHMPGARQASAYPWPYTEGLRLDEANHDLSFIALGLYGKVLTPQNGAPMRLVVPWKYGYKSAKSLVKIEFTKEKPATFWNTLAPQEYGFESNVDPAVPHPRWSQATELPLGENERIPTLIYNGYKDQVASLYDT